GFEHLLENLGLGRLVFEKSHTLSLHKVNGSFQEVHDKLNLHQHSHDKSSEIKKRSKRHATEGGDDKEVKITYVEPETAWRSQCLTPQDLLLTFGLEPHHKAEISQRAFLEICPAIIYELDQRTCYTTSTPHYTENLYVSQFTVWLYASVSILTISLIGLVGVAVVPLIQKSFFQQVLQFLVALAVGTMSGDALLHLLPHALISHSSEGGHDHFVPVLRASVTFLAIGVFFILEAILHNINNNKSTKKSESEIRSQANINERKPLKSNDDPEMTYCEFEIGMTSKNVSHQHSHQHVSQKGETVGSVAWMVIMGDGLHNLTDGLAIGAAFSGDVVAGFATAVAVLCHELPHELGDFAVLLQAGMSIKTAMIYNIISSILSFIGMAFGVWIGEYEQASLWIYAFTAGVFLYISLVDLVNIPIEVIPEMNNHLKNSKNLSDIAFQIGGICIMNAILLLNSL
ncbi:hypothetical protein L9F63_000871, partial [Diploptera punctata]